MNLVDFVVLGQRAKAGLMAILSFSSPCEADIRAEGSDGVRELRRCEASIAGVGCDVAR